MRTKELYKLMTFDKSYGSNAEGITGTLGIALLSACEYRFPLRRQRVAGDVKMAFNEQRDRA